MKIIITRWTPLNMEGSGAGYNCFGASKMIFFLEIGFMELNKSTLFNEGDT